MLFMMDFGYDDVIEYDWLARPATEQIWFGSMWIGWKEAV